MVGPSNDCYWVYRVILSSENRAMGGTDMKVESTKNVRWISMSDPTKM